MSLYGSGKFFFGANSLPQTEKAQFWGSNEFNFSSASPSVLTAYQNVTGTVILYWTLNPVGTYFNSISWTIETDLVSTFDSPDKLTYTSSDPNYIDGYTHKGIAVPVYSRLQGEKRPMYWRVWGTMSGIDTAIVSRTFMIPEAIDQVVKQEMIDALPDIIYKKDLSGGDTNLAKLYHAIGLTMDTMNLERILTLNDTYTATVRDESLDNFSSLLKVIRPAGMEAIDFREILRVMLREAGRSPGISSVKELVKSIFGVYPDIFYIRDIADMYVSDPTSIPAVEPFYVDDSTSSPTVDAGTIWDNANLGFGTIIKINNPLSLPITRQFVESVVYKFVPSFSPIYLQF